MKAQSKSYPKQFQPQQGGFLFNYNVQEIEREGEKFYSYDSVWVAKRDKNHIVPAIVRSKYSENDEFKMGRISKTSTEWQEYDSFVKEAIKIADGV